MRKCLLALAMLAPAIAIAQKDSTRELHVVGPRKDIYQAVVAKPKAAVYGTVLRLLVDSGYTTKNANQDAGIIQTEVRDKTFLTAGKGFRDKMRMAVYNSIALDITLTPLPSDSTRIQVTGTSYIDYHGMLGGSAPNRQNIRIVSEKADWDQVRWFGDALLALLEK